MALVFVSIACFLFVSGDELATDVVIVPPSTLHGKPVQLSEELQQETNQFVFCRELWTLAAGERGQAARECTLFSDSGMEVETAAKMTDGHTYHVVPVGNRFVWPPKEIGWKVSVEGLKASPDGEDVMLETLSIKPPIFRLHNFITDEEVDFMVENAVSLGLERSTGGLQTSDADSDVNQGAYTSHRTSTNAWDIDSEVSVGIQKRSFEMLRFKEFKEEQADGLQVVKYTEGQFYHHHTDWFDKNESPYWNWDPMKGGSNRFATVFIYLSDTEMGGETVFPYAERGPADDLQGTDEEAFAVRDRLWGDKQDRLEYKMATECRSKFAVTPKKGEAVLFYHQDRTGALDVLATHGACPILKGDKWGANLWIWNNDSWTLEQEHALGGQPDPSARDIQVVNDLGVTADVFWVNTEGGHNLVATMEPGVSKDMGSYIHHVFVAKAHDDHDSVLAQLKVKRSQEDQLYHFKRQAHSEL